MNEQIGFMGTDIPMSDEERLFQDLKPCLLSIMEQNGLPKEKLEISAMKSYYSVTIDTKYLVCRIGHNKKEFYISFHALRTSQTNLLESFCTKQTKVDRESNFIRVLLPDLKVSSELEVLMSAVIRNTIDSIPKEFDCCSRYEQCSDARGCVHPDPEFVLNCGYGRILNSGRVFYGKNRNV